IPALLKMMSRRPKLFSANATMPSASFAFETSAPNALAFAPISFAVASAVSFFRSTTTTFAPSFANRRQDALPMPLPPPVINATLFANRMRSPSALGTRHSSSHLEVPPPLPVGHDGVEFSLLGSEEMQVVIDDVLA